MKMYLINESVCWADEFDVPFYELLDETEYQKYMYLKEKLGKFCKPLYFGTNEGWEYDEDFNYLNFQPKEIPEEHADILKRYWPYECLTIYDQLTEKIDDFAYDQLGYCISDLSLDGFKTEFEKLKW